jgi:hypothetical protein
MIEPFALVDFSIRDQTKVPRNLSIRADTLVVRQSAQNEKVAREIVALLTAHPDHFRHLILPRAFREHCAQHCARIASVSYEDVSTVTLFAKRFLKFRSTNISNNALSS